jgi:glycosyltransferase involved in cell wall biosynthesis
VAIEHPDTWVDEDTHALADALDRAGVLGDEEGARWTIRWLPSPAGHVRSGHGGTALRLALSEPEPPADARRADLLLVASEADATTCVAAGVPAAQLAVVPPAVDTLRFRPGTAPLRLGQEGTFAFLLVTRWGGRQGWDRVVAAYLRAFGARDRTSLVIVVVGPDIPSEEQAGAEILALIEAADRHEDDLPDIALHTTLPLERLPSIHAGADCLVVPAVDGWGTRTAIEGMASGLPVIAPLNPVLAGVLDGSSGVPLPDRWDETDLAQELADAASDPAHAARLGAEARRRAVATWSGGRAAAAAIRALGLPAPRELHDGP